jgi:hypothetical protein
MPDSVDQFTDAQGVRVPDRGRRQIPMVTLQHEQREVQAPAALYHVSVERPAVVKSHPDVTSLASS